MNQVHLFIASACILCTQVPLHAFTEDDLAKQKKRNTDITVTSSSILEDLQGPTDSSSHRTPSEIASDIVSGNTASTGDTSPL